jgi:hypothetical protein
MGRLPAYPGTTTLVSGIVVAILAAQTALFGADFLGLRSSLMTHDVGGLLVLLVTHTIVGVQAAGHDPVWMAEAARTACSVQVKRG